MNIKKHLPWLGALLPIINAQADTNPNVVIIYIDEVILAVMEENL
jgi:hypothetical protein